MEYEPQKRKEERRSVYGLMCLLARSHGTGLLYLDVRYSVDTPTMNISEYLFRRIYEIKTAYVRHREHSQLRVVPWRGKISQW